MFVTMLSQAGSLTVPETPLFLLARSSTGVSRHECLAVVIIGASKKVVDSNACIKCIRIPAVTEVAAFSRRPLWYLLQMKRLTSEALSVSHTPFRSGSCMPVSDRRKFFHIPQWLSYVRRVAVDTDLLMKSDKYSRFSTETKLSAPVHGSKEVEFFHILFIAGEMTVVNM